MQLYLASLQENLVTGLGAGETLFLYALHLMDVRKVINWGGVQQAETPLVTPNYLIFRAHVTLS